MRALVVMMTGTSLSLKSLTAGLLSKREGLAWVNSSSFGDFASGNGLSANDLARTRAMRHRRMQEVFARKVAMGESFIIDSGFSSRSVREEYYRLFEQHSRGGRLVLLWCHCDDLDLVWSRLYDRRNDPESTEPTFTDSKALLMARQGYESPLDPRDVWPSGRPVEMVSFDTATFAVKEFGASLEVERIGQSVRQLVATGQINPEYSLVFSPVRG